MSPRSSTFLALFGVLLAGIPLPALTATRGKVSASVPATAAVVETYPVSISLTCSGSPTGLRLLHAGRELVQLSGKDLEYGWGGEIHLPKGEPVALELIASWPGSGMRQAVTLELEWDGEPTMAETQWTDPGSDTLHSLFMFTW